MTQAFRSRRQTMFSLAACGTVLLGASACSKDEDDVGAVEDLMREHGVIRRAILVYRYAATRLRAGEPIDPQPLQKTATLFRNFGEDYHERKLEEENIFPALQKANSPAASYVDVLKAQHDRGREITDYLMNAISQGTLTSNAEQIAAALNALELMYEHHAAREDTVVFPAWKATMSKHQLDEMGDKFENIEKQQFGKDGFDDAVKQMAEIEQALGLADLAQFTPASPA